MDRLSITPTRSLINQAIFGQNEPLRLVVGWPRYVSIGVKCISQGHYDTLTS